jgi:hypothetical protein
MTGKAFLQAPPPAPECRTRRRPLMADTVEGVPQQNQADEQFLHGPQVPAPGRNALGQAGAGPTTVGAAETGNGNRVQALSLAIGFSGVVAMTPEACTTARGALIREILLRMGLQMFEMLAKRVNT